MAKNGEDIYKNHPFWQVAAEADKIAGQGKFDVHQKFTCAGCGKRLTIDQPNIFHRTGRCQECGAITDIEKDGCNYLLMTKGMSGA